MPGVVNQRVGLRPAGLDEQHAVLADSALSRLASTQPGRSGADDDEVELGIARLAADHGGRQRGGREKLAAGG